VQSKKRITLAFCTCCHSTKAYSDKKGA
jgi:hypothetical protein